MSEINSIEDFNRWVKIQLVIKNTSLRKLAKTMNISYSRLSEAANGRPSGIKYMIPLILELDGDLNDFDELLKNTARK